MPTQLCHIAVSGCLRPWPGALTRSARALRGWALVGILALLPERLSAISTQLVFRNVSDLEKKRFGQVLVINGDLAY